MKKNFFNTVMAIVAIVTVATMTSCSSDSGNNIDPTPTPVDDNVIYSYAASMSNDMLKFYDITITRTVGSDTKTYNLTSSSDYADMMTTGIDKFVAKKGVKVSVTAKFTVKSDFQDVLDKIIAERGTDARFQFDAIPSYNFKSISTGLIKGSGNPFTGTYKASTMDKEGFDTIAEFMEGVFSVDND